MENQENFVRVVTIVKLIATGTVEQLQWAALTVARGATWFQKYDPNDP